MLHNMFRATIAVPHDIGAAVVAQPKREGVGQTGMPRPTTPPLPSAKFKLPSNDSRTKTPATKASGARKVGPRVRGGDRSHYSEEGKYAPEEPRLLPGLQIQRRTFTPAELLERFGDTDITYSFVNGSEANHQYRKLVQKACLMAVLKAENDSYMSLNRDFTAGASTTSPRKVYAATPAEMPAEAAADQKRELLSGLQAATTSAPLNTTSTTATTPFSHLSCVPSLLRPVLGPRKTFAELVKRVTAAAGHGVDNRDRETDELRHSLRSVEQHVRWHRGRVVMVSPGHHPTWVDGAKNFLAGMCGGARVQALRSSGTHLRVTTVHQDAVMPYGMRLTVDSHVIEQHLWRVRNMTPVHVYMNDDYFVNRDVAITDLFNEYGGTIVRTEGPSVAEGRRGDVSASWVEGVANTELFNIYHLEHLHEDFLPRPLLDSWRRLLKRSGHETQSASNGLMSFLKWKLSEMLAPARRRGVGTTDGGADDAAARAEFEQEARYILGFSDLLSAANTSSYWEAALSNPTTPTSLPSGRHRGVQKHYYATHAPFVYCTNMFRHWSVRFRDEFADLQLHHRERRARDLFVPFLYNAFIMARPWQASPKFLPYLLELKEAMEAAAADAKAMLAHLRQTETVSLMDALREEFQKHLAKYVPMVSIFLDNDDGCAPATLYRNPAAEVMYMRATNNIEENKRAMDDVARQDPLYFNINAGFSSAEAADQLRRFLHGKFPTPVYLEVGGAPPPGEGLVDGAGELVGGRTRAAGAAAAAEEEALSRLFGDLMALPVVGVVSYEEGVCPLVRSLALAFAGHHRGGVRVSVEQHGGAALREARAALGHRVVSAMPAPACAYKEQVSVDPAARGESVAEIARRAMGEMRGGVELPSTCGAGGAGLRVRGFVVDARTRGAPVRSAAALRDALAVPAQTLSLEDFRAVAVGPSEGDVVLVVSREDAEAKAVHWVNGASESDLLVTYPLPVEAYEDMGAEVRWSVP